MDAHPHPIGVVVFRMEHTSRLLSPEAIKGRCPSAQILERLPYPLPTRLQLTPTKSKALSNSGRRLPGCGVWYHLSEESRSISVVGREKRF